jgi:hypothetical protein
MINSQEVTIEVPQFDLPVILAFNAALWVAIIAAAVALA